jgi:GNAT superfamily N-acetyltransferase
MDREAWLGRMRDSMEAFFRAMIAATPSARAVEGDGVVATVIPVTPDRSVFNSVVYAGADGLAAAYDDLAAAYERAGVRAWTVWVPEDDARSRATLESAGHVLDAAPRAMVIDLDGYPAPDMAGIDWTTDPDTPPEVGRLNDVAYGIPTAGFEAAMGDGLVGVRSYVARLDGEPAACVSVTDHDRDAGIWAVATAPEARGRGLSTALMRQALHDAAARGCQSSTLQATKLGAPVYETVGYRDLGAIEMWERRTPAADG